MAYELYECKPMSFHVCVCCALYKTQHLDGAHYIYVE